MGSVALAAGSPNGTVWWTKSFLVLFFKKERLADLLF
jgi:hypothetical protein